MKATVCELRNDPAGLEQDWLALVAHTTARQTDLVLLPEMTFHPWLAGSRNVDAQLWQDAINAHDKWFERLPELGARLVIGTRPVVQNGQRWNRGYIWQLESGSILGHAKYYVPDEKGYWEASWYSRGDGVFNVISVEGLRIGFLICTELWFAAHAREYMLQGIDLLVCPRATPAKSADKWLAGGRTAAVISGAFCLSSNFTGPNPDGSDFGGTGWIIDPEEGEVLGVTSRNRPYLTIDIDLTVARHAKQTYPRYVRS